MRRWFHRFRSSVTGRYTTKDDARGHPAETVEEREAKPTTGPWDRTNGPEQKRDDPK